MGKRRKGPKNPAITHRRWPDPQPRLGVWTMRCTCGWSHGIVLRGSETRGDVETRMEKAFVAHLEPDQLQTGLLVDARPFSFGERPDGSEIMGVRGTWIMPEGSPAVLTSWYEAEDVRYGVIDDGRTFPIVELRTPEGRVIRMND